MKKRYTYMMLAAMLLSCFGCQTKKQDLAASSQTYPIIIATDSPSDTVTGLFAEKFAQEVIRLSEGKIQMKVYDNGVLGGDRELLESCKNDDIAFVVQSSAPQVNFMPNLLCLICLLPIQIFHRCVKFWMMKIFTVRFLMYIKMEGFILWLWQIKTFVL